MQVFWIAIAGALGVVARYGINSCASAWGLQIPYATVLINVMGSFLIGLLWAASQKSLPFAQLDKVLMVGFLGGFTTFSAYSLEGLQLWQQNTLGGALYWVGTPILSIAAVYLGVSLI